jgi:HEAT repeat protein
VSTEHEFESALGFLRPEDEVIDAFPIFWLSDLDSHQLKMFSSAWKQLRVGARRNLMARMEEEARVAFELDFIAIARIALKDADGEVRTHAIGALWECTDMHLADEFLKMLVSDEIESVRAAAAGALGSLIYQAEMSEPPPAMKTTMEDALIKTVRGKESADVRRRALEALGYSSRDEIPKLIQLGYHDSLEAMRASALRAMGRSADPRWEKEAIAELENLSPLIRAEAARASGELSLKRATRKLIALLDDVDEPVRHEAIRSLGEIGGEQAQEALESMKERANAAETDLIEEALEAAEFEESLDHLEIFHIEDDDEEEDDSLEEDDERESGSGEDENE